MTKSEIEIMRQNMRQAHFFSEEDIAKICDLEMQYAEECKQIAEGCIEEGYPGHGSNYELRCDNARRYYDEQIELIESAYPELQEEL